MRINKYLATCGLGSRRSVEDLIKKGLISINDKVVYGLSFDVSSNDIVKYKGKTVSLVEDKVYIMLNKPKCYITSTKDEQGRKVVLDLLKGCKYKVFSVGRLDYNTEGLLLLTNDGDWANNITHPSNHISKTYAVSTKYMLTNKQLNQIRNGIVIDDRRTLPAKINLVDKDEKHYYYHITIYEGRNREIRKMFEFLELKIYSLKRLQIGDLSLGNLEEGKFRYLDKKEINKVFEGE
jgi:23S rRNA pseudouridine2605 synthase